MPGPHSGPYESQQPNANRDEQVAQAGEILARLGLGQSTRQIAAAMNISRGTLYARIRLINEPLPDPETLRVIHFERLEAMFEGLEGRAGDASNADYSRLRAEQRQVLARQSALLGGDAPTRTHATVDNRPSADEPRPEILDLIEDLEGARDARDDDGP